MFDFTPFHMLNQLENAQAKCESEYRAVTTASSSSKSNTHSVETLAAQRQVVREALESACTAICVGGEEFVRAIDVKAMLRIVCRIIGSCDESQVAMLTLAFRTLALIADTVPQANVVMATASRENRTVPLLVEYLAKPHVLLSYDDLAEEILRCLSFIALVDCGANVLFEHKVVDHLLSLECLFTDVAYLGQLCLDTLHRIFSLMNPQRLGSTEVALLQLLQNMDDSISVAFNVPSPSALRPRTTNTASSPQSGATSASPPLPAAAAAAGDDVVIPDTNVTCLPVDKLARLRSYCLCLASTFERVSPVSPTRHRVLLASAFDVCTRLAGFACRLHGEQRQSLLILALSPVANLYVVQPVDMVPFVIESALLEKIAQIVLEVLASPMRVTVEGSDVESPAGGAEVLTVAAGATSTTDGLVASAAVSPRPSPRIVAVSPRRNPDHPLYHAEHPSPRRGAGRMTSASNSHRDSPRDARVSTTELNRLPDYYTNELTRASVADADASDAQAVALLGGSHLLSSSSSSSSSESGRAGNAGDSLNNTAHLAGRANMNMSGGHDGPLSAGTPRGGGGGETAALVADGIGATGNAPAENTRSTAGQRAPTFATLLLGHDTSNLPFISEELCVMPLLELLLVLLPPTRRSADSHFDHLNLTQPFFGWQWEDDFHNKNDCAEGLGQRLEREYQKKRNQGLKPGERVMVAHTTPKLLSVDYLGLQFSSSHSRNDRRLFRNAAVCGFSHHLLNGLGAGCCCGLDTYRIQDGKRAAKASKKEASKQRKRNAQLTHRGRRQGSVVEASPVANPFARGLPTIMSHRLSDSQSPRHVVAVRGDDTPHAPLRRVGSHRRADAAVVTDEAPSMVDDGRANLEQSSLTQFLFEASHTSLEGSGAHARATPSARSPRTGAAFAASPRALRAADTRVVVVPGTASTHNAQDAATALLGTGVVTLMSGSTSGTTSSSSIHRSDSSTSSPDSSSQEESSAVESSPMAGAANHRHNNSTSRRLDFRPHSETARAVEASNTNARPLPSSTSRGALGAVAAATLDGSERSTQVSASIVVASARRSGWSCCRASGVADNRADVGRAEDAVSTRAASPSSGHRGVQSTQGSGGTRHSRSHMSSAALLPVSSAKDDRRLLQDLAEALLSSPTLRHCFLQEVIMRTLLSRFLPRLLAIIRNSVNPIVVRHASVLLLRCTSLACEWSELEASSGPGTTPSKAKPAVVAVAASTKMDVSLRSGSLAYAGDHSYPSKDGTVTLPPARKTSFFSLSSSRTLMDRSHNRPNKPALAGGTAAPSSVTNPLVGDLMATASTDQPGVVAGPNALLVRDALMPHSKALAETLVYLLSTNMDDGQPLLGPFFPFRSYGEDARMLYTAMQMGFSVQFCSYAPTARGEMRLAAADAVLHLLRFEKRLGTGTISVDKDAPGASWHVFTLPEERAVEQLVVGLANTVQADVSENQLVVGHGCLLNLAGAALAMERAAFAKRDSSPADLIKNTTEVPSHDCPYHNTLPAARLTFIDAFRRVGQAMGQRTRARSIDAEAGAAATRLVAIGKSKPVWEESDPERDAIIGASLDISSLKVTECASASGIARSKVSTAAARTSADGTNAIQSEWAYVARENTLGMVTPNPLARTGHDDEADESGVPASQGEASHGDKGSQSRRTAYAAAAAAASVATTPLSVASCIDLSEPVHLRRALESRVLALETAAEVPVCAARLAVALYYLLQETDLTMRVLVTKAPEVLNEVAQALLLWAYPRFRDGENRLASGGAVSTSEQLIHDVGEERAQVTENLSPATHRQLAALTQELTFAVGERLGLASGVSRTSNVAPLLPVRFTKRVSKSKLSATVADLTWSPIPIHLQRFVNPRKSARAASAINKSALADADDEREVPTTDEDRCELHIYGHVLRYLPVELDTRALLVTCTSSIGALQSLIVQHTIAPFLPAQEATGAANGLHTPRGNDLDGPRGGSPALSAGEAGGRSQPSRASAEFADSSSSSDAASSEDSDDDEATEPQRGRDGRQRHLRDRRASGASRAATAAPPMWLSRAPRMPATSPTGSRTPMSPVYTQHTTAVLRSGECLDAPLFDARCGPNDGVTASGCRAGRSAELGSVADTSPALSSSQVQAPTGTATRRNSSADEHVISTTGEPAAAISASRLLLLIDGVPLLCPMTALVDALCYFARSGQSLRDYVDEDALESDDDDNAANDEGSTRQTAGSSSPATRATSTMDENAAAMALRRLTFWVTIHRIQYVLLEAPLPMSLRLVHSKCGCRGGAPITPGAPSFYCAPKHLFSMLHATKCEPSDGALRLLHALTLAARESPQSDGGGGGGGGGGISRRGTPAGSPLMGTAMGLMFSATVGTASPDGAVGGGALADPNSALFREHRLRSALVHDLYGQLDTILLPPLMYRYLGDCFDYATVGSHLASYALWNYPLVFPFAMRVTLLDLFLGARRTMSARVINGTTRFLRSQVGSRFLGFQWMSTRESTVTTNTTRVPVKVRRDRLLEDGAQVLRRYAFCPFPLDVHFRGEPGIGIGPALELFELMAKALASPETGMWRTETDANGQRVVGSLLYPSAYQTPRSLLHFETLGLLMGRLLMLHRPTCIRFHPLFLRRLLYRSCTSSEQEASRSMALLDHDLEKMLLSLSAMSEEELEGCGLSFVLPASEPGQPEIPLCDNGANVPLTRANVHAHATAVRMYCLEYIPDLVLQSFRVGLQFALNPVYLSIFTVDEISSVLSGPTGKLWPTQEAFRRDVVPQHGYTSHSPMIRYLVEIVPSWSEAQQRAFLRFVTGAGTLPAGGLTDPIKVVRRDAAAAAEAAGALMEDAETTAPEDQSRTQPSNTGTSRSRDGGDAGAGSGGAGSLPTASTCFHYLKLPQYPSRAILEARLLRAVEEGQSGFMLT